MEIKRFAIFEKKTMPSLNDFILINSSNDAPAQKAIDLSLWSTITLTFGFKEQPLISKVNLSNKLLVKQFCFG